ncbi:MAG: glucosamine-6-phosphate deaminase [Lachnospiraceae bacterium]|jgi:glucosamine-6-phosphate deaminase|nr:glucosamine-6-phosphate deaminase [Lachnospiraceae bacterium]
MKLIVTESYEESSRVLADMFEEVITKKPDAVLGLATGSSPVGLYRYLVQDYKAGKLDFSKIHTINLDEYEGLSRSHEQSFGYFMDKHLFSEVNLKEENIMLVDGAGDMEEQIKRYDDFLEENPIDILVLGIGNNGHIGFNEPDEVFWAGTHLVKLEEETIKANARFFEKESDVPGRAVTMGMSGIVNAEKVVLIASGKAKADAVCRLLEDDKIDPMLPCSILKVCRDAVVIVDRELYEQTGRDENE